MWDNDTWRPFSAAGREALMGSKDTGSRNTNRVATKGLQQKRLEKRANRSATEGMANQSVDRAIGH